MWFLVLCKQVASTGRQAIDRTSCLFRAQYHVGRLVVFDCMAHLCCLVSVVWLQEEHLRCQFHICQNKSTEGGVDVDRNGAFSLSTTPCKYLVYMCFKSDRPCGSLSLACAPFPLPPSPWISHSQCSNPGVCVDTFSGLRVRLLCSATLKYIIIKFLFLFLPCQLCRTLLVLFGVGMQWIFSSGHRAPPSPELTRHWSLSAA